MDTVIFSYSLDQAMEDGMLQLEGWLGHKLLVATQGTAADLPSAERREHFRTFLRWQRDVEPTLEEQDRMFVAKASNGRTIWVIDDGTAITLLYPSEY